MKRYVIWDKQSNVITPIGEVLTPAQWVERYPVAGVDGIKTVVAGGTINGAFFGVFDSMVDMYEKEGCNFTTCISNQDYLDAIEAFEDERNARASEEVSIEERTAAALELLALSTLPDEE